MASRFWTWTKGDRRNAAVAYRDIDPIAGLMPVFDGTNNEIYWVNRKDAKVNSGLEQYMVEIQFFDISVEII